MINCAQEEYYYEDYNTILIAENQIVWDTDNDDIK